MIERPKTLNREKRTSSLERGNRGRDRTFRMSRNYSDKVSDVLPEEEQGFLSSLKEKGAKINPDHVIKPKSSINIGGKPRKRGLSPGEKIANIVIHGINKILKPGKENVIAPALYAQVNTLEISMGKFFDSPDFETSRKAGGIFVPKGARIFSSVNYVATWSGNLLYAISPYAAKKVFQGTEIVKNTLFYPIRRSWAGLRKLVKKGESLFYSKAEWKKILHSRETERANFEKKTHGRVRQLKDRINENPEIKEYKMAA